MDSVVSVGEHAYREDLRKAIYRFMNLHLKGDAQPVTDSEVDLVTVTGEQREHPIPPEQLRVFPEGAALPEDAVNDRIDRDFVPVAQVMPPEAGAFPSWKEVLLTKLRRMTFPHFPERIPAGAVDADGGGLLHLGTEPGITIRLREAASATGDAGRVLLWVTASDVRDAPAAWLETIEQANDAVYVCEPRGIGGTRWTQKNPPNYVARAHFLLGRTVDSGRVWDIAAAARFLQGRHRESPVYLAGENASAILVACAALLEPDIAGLILKEPPATFMDDAAPVLLNVLRVCDVPEIIGMLAPRPLTFAGGPGTLTGRVEAIYRAAGAHGRLDLRK